MNTPVSNHDLERLSAYLDGALPAGEQRQVATRLQHEPDLAAALQQLAATRALLRRAPQRRAPRHFTLTPAMAGLRQAGGGWLGWGLASAVSSLLLVATLLLGQPLGAAAPAMLSVQSADEVAPEALAAPMLEAAPKDAEAGDEAAEAEEPMEDAAGGAGEISGDAGNAEMFATPSEEMRSLPMEPAPFDWFAFLMENRLWIAVALAGIAVATALTAWRRRRRY